MRVLARADGDPRSHRAPSNRFRPAARSRLCVGGVPSRALQQNHTTVADVSEHRDSDQARGPAPSAGRAAPGLRRSGAGGAIAAFRTQGCRSPRSQLAHPAPAAGRAAPPAPEDPPGTRGGDRSTGAGSLQPRCAEPAPDPPHATRWKPTAPCRASVEECQGAVQGRTSWCFWNCSGPRLVWRDSRIGSWLRTVSALTPRAPDPRGGFQPPRGSHGVPPRARTSSIRRLRLAPRPHVKHPDRRRRGWRP